MKPKKGKKVAKSFQFIALIAIGIAMAILGAVTSFAVAKSIASSGSVGVTNTQPVQKEPAKTQSETPSAPNVIPVAVAATAPAATPAATPTTNTEKTSSEILAKIIRIQPEYDTKTTPYTTCHWIERPVVVHYHRAVDGSGVLIGGVTGGIIGHQIGRGHGNVAATIGGTVLGALAGNQMEREMNRPEVQYVSQRVCKKHYEKKSVLTGYNVTYVYNGKEETTFMKKKPQSDFIKLTLTPSAE